MGKSCCSGVRNCFLSTAFDVSSMRYSAIWLLRHACCCATGVSKSVASCLGAQMRVPSTLRMLSTTAHVQAGHNKWSKVRHIKGPKDQEKSMIFNKLSIMIRQVVREGGPDPKLNTQLANLINQCRAKNMPNSTWQTAIKGADKNKPMTMMVYGVRNPSGALMLIEAYTDNIQRTNMVIRQLVNKHGGVQAEVARRAFEQKGFVTVLAKDAEGQNVGLEKAIELAMDVGAEDVQEEEGDDERQDKQIAKLQFVCAPQCLHKVKSELAAQGLALISSSLGFVPNSTVALDPGQMEQVSRLIEAICTCPDVVDIYDNITTS
uniref:translational activator of cytochrome c oxidase 1 n=1 Tax=Myxine glutinosa TaxID=7769 RepID=UPI00358E5BB9